METETAQIEILCPPLAGFNMWWRGKKGTAGEGREEGRGMGRSKPPFSLSGKGPAPVIRVRLLLPPPTPHLDLSALNIIVFK